MSLEREFQQEEVAMEKALSPQVQCLVMLGGARKFASADRRPHGCMAV